MNAPKFRTICTVVLLLCDCTTRFYCDCSRITIVTLRCILALAYETVGKISLRDAAVRDTIPAEWYKE